MRAVRKTRLVCDLRQVVVCKQKQVFRLAKANEFYVLLAALSITVVKYLCKVRIAHVAHFGQKRDIYIFVRMPVDIKNDIFDGVAFRIRKQARIHNDALVMPSPYKIGH